MEVPHSEAVSKASHPIKIDTVEPILIKPTTRGYAFLIVRIRTDQGIDGIGECHASGERDHWRFETSWVQLRENWKVQTRWKFRPF